MSARILVVEDEEALTTLLRYNLETEGYEVEAVARTYLPARVVAKADTSPRGRRSGICWPSIM